MIGVVSAFLVIVTAFGPECVAFRFLWPRLTLNPRRNHGSHFEKAKMAFEEGGGRDELIEDLILSEKRGQAKENPDERMVGKV